MTLGDLANFMLHRIEKLRREYGLVRGRPETPNKSAKTQRRSRQTLGMTATCKGFGANIVFVKGAQGQLIPYSTDMTGPRA